MKTLLSLLSISFFILASSSSVRAENNVGTAFSVWPDTGQNKCYNESGEIPCPSEGEPFYGQDAQYQGPQRSYTKLGYNGVELPDTATIEDGWIMTRDNVTGLIWEVKTNKDNQQDYNNIHDANNSYTWCDEDLGDNERQGVCGDGTDTDDFITALKTSLFGGYNDWRLPTVKELATLLNSSVPYPGPIVDTVYFPNAITSWNWSSTPYVLYGNRAWTVSLGSSEIAGSYAFGDYYVRAVRGGQTQPLSFTNNGDGTITDNRTGLMWMRCSIGQTYDPTTDRCENSLLTYTWQQALAECENLEFAGYNDWRLPNRNELMSIVDYSKVVPSVDTTYFPDIPSRHADYWSSTTDTYARHAAWRVNFNDGNIYSDNKRNNHYVRAVRLGASKVAGDLVFTDVSQDYWAHNYISLLYQSGITRGCGNTSFCPDRPVTRAQMAVFLERGIHGSNFTPPALMSSFFGDVPMNHWAGSWIKQLYEDGITRGCGNNNFCPEQPVTRAQMAVFLLRSKYGSDYSPPNASGVFDDVPTDYWAAGWIEQLAADGITSGCGNGNYCPDQEVTRAQMAVFLVRAFNLNAQGK